MDKISGIYRIYNKITYKSYIGSSYHIHRWTLPKEVQTETIKKSRRWTSYKVVAPDGVIHDVGFGKFPYFCKTNGLNCKGLYRMAKGRRTHYKGWKLYIGDKI